MTKTTRSTLIWIAIIVAFLGFLFGIRAVLLPFVLGILTAYFLDPVVDRIQAKNIRRNMATVVVTIVFFAITIAIFVVTVPLIGEQLFGLIEHMPNYMKSLTQQYNSALQAVLNRLPADQENVVQKALSDVSGMFANLLTELLQGLFASGATVLNVISMLLITPLVTFYLLRDWDDIIESIRDLLPRKHAAVIQQQLHEIDRTLSGFIHGQLLVCTILASFYVACFSLVGLKFSLIIGAATGFLIIIPYVGWAAGAITGMLVAIWQYESWLMIGVIAGIFLIGQVIESWFLTPQMIGRKVGLHPVWLIFGMLAGGALLGFVGVLLAVPLTAVIGVLMRFAIQYYRHSELYLGPPRAGKK